MMVNANQITAIVECPLDHDDCYEHECLNIFFSAHSQIYFFYTKAEV